MGALSYSIIGWPSAGGVQPENPAYIHEAPYTEISKLLTDFNADVVELLRSVTTAFLAGGALRSLVSSDETISDYDIFFRESLDDVGKARTYLEEHGWTCVWACPENKLYTYKNEDIKVQLITECAYLNMHNAINEFDITACCAAIDGNGTLIMHDDFSKAVLEKEVRLNKVTYPVATMKRIYKYMQKGYNCSSDVIREFLQAVNTMEDTGDLWRAYID